LIVALARQLNPRLRPRYIAKVEHRIFLEEPEQQRIPDLLVEKLRDNGSGAVAVQPTPASPVILEAEGFQFQEEEISEAYIQVLDRYRAMKVVTVLELLSPTNKETGAGRNSYLLKQRQVLDSHAHLVEIDLLRKGRYTLSVPQKTARTLGAFDYLICVNRYPERHRFELYPCTLSSPLPCLRIPLAEGDADVSLDLQAAIGQVYEEGSYSLYIRYEDPCEPALSPENQQWAWSLWRGFRESHPELFPPAPPVAPPTP
jgi:hypothetical protein